MYGNTRWNGRVADWQKETLGAEQPFNAGNSGATFTPDCSNGASQIVTLTAACTIAAPTGTPAVPPGSKLFLVLVQDATAGRAVTWGAGYRDAPAIGGALATAGQRAGVEFRYDGASWECCGGATAFA